MGGNDADDYDAFLEARAAAVQARLRTLGVPVVVAPDEDEESSTTETVAEEGAGDPDAAAPW